MLDLLNRGDHDGTNKQCNFRRYNMNEGSKWKFESVAWYLYVHGTNASTQQELVELSGWQAESIKKIVTNKLWQDQVGYEEPEEVVPSGVDADQIDNIVYAEMGLARDGSNAYLSYKIYDDGSSCSLEREDEPQELDFS
jgi:hypothetical protein